MDNTIPGSKFMCVAKRFLLLSSNHKIRILLFVIVVASCFFCPLVSQASSEDNNSNLIVCDSCYMGAEESYPSLGISITVERLVKEERFQTRISEVFPDSPAEGSKLLIGDIIQSVNGKPADSSLPGELANLLSSEPDEKMELEILRYGKLIKVTIYPKAYSTKALVNRLIISGTDETEEFSKTKILRALRDIAKYLGEIYFQGDPAVLDSIVAYAKNEALRIPEKFYSTYIQIQIYRLRGDLSQAIFHSSEYDHRVSTDINELIKSKRSNASQSEMLIYIKGLSLAGGYLKMAGRSPDTRALSLDIYNTALKESSEMSGEEAIKIKEQLEQAIKDTKILLERRKNLHIENGIHKTIK